MGFYQQPNDWTCGPFALKHALYALGQFVSEDRVAKLAKTHWWAGTSEIGLTRAARTFGAALGLERKYDAESARRALLAHLARKIPVLLCVDDWGHWICVLRHHRGEFVVVDSNLDQVLAILTWPRLSKRWRYDDIDYSEEAPPTLYDLMPVRPLHRVTMRADFSPARVRFLRRSQNQGLALCWDAYVTDLVAICRPKNSQMSRPLSMAEFLRRHRRLISTRVAYWHGEVDEKAIVRQLDYFQFVAETYGLVVRNADSTRALTDLSILLTLWVGARRPVVPFYEPS